MRALTAAQKSALRDPLTRIAILLEMGHPSGTKYLWSGTGTLEADGQDWIGCGLFGAIEGLEHDDEVNERLDVLNRDPRFEGVYTQYLEGWRDNGGELLMHFVHTAAANEWGRFGASEWTGQPRSETPKLRAIIRFVDANRRWW